MADAFCLKRPDRCPARILRMYDPRASAGIVTVDTRSSKLSAKMMNSYCTGASTRVNPVHLGLPALAASKQELARELMEKDRARIFVEG